MAQPPLAPPVVDNIEQVVVPPKKFTTDIEMVPLMKKTSSGNKMVVQNGGLVDDKEVAPATQAASHYDPYHSPFSPYNLNNPNILHSNSFLQKADETNFSFHVTINLYLQKGKTISTEQKQHLKCERLENNIFGDIADIQGKKFEIPPDYDMMKKDKDKEKEKKGGSRKMKRTSTYKKSRRRKYKK